MNTSLVFVLKSESCGYKQNRQLSFLVERDTKIANFKVKAHKKGIPVYKICITNNTDGKGRVECWTLSLPYHYKQWYKLISMHWLIKCCIKKMRSNYVLVRPTEKASCKSATSGKNESRAPTYIWWAINVTAQFNLIRVHLNVTDWGLGELHTEFEYVFAGTMCFVLCL